MEDNIKKEDAIGNKSLGSDTRQLTSRARETALLSRKAFLTSQKGNSATLITYYPSGDGGFRSRRAAFLTSSPRVGKLLCKRNTGHDFLRVLPRKFSC